MATPTGSTLKKPLLELSTLASKDLIGIDGKRYPLNAADRMSILEFTRLQADIRVYDELMIKFVTTGLTEQEAKDLTQVVHETLLPRAIEAPPEVRARLTDSQAIDVIQRFAGLSQTLRNLRRAPIDEAPQVTKAKATGEKPSPDSSGSTVALRKTG